MGQLFDSRGRHPERCAENLRVMLAQRRRGDPNLPRRLRKLYRRAGILVMARDRLGEAASDDLRVGPVLEVHLELGRDRFLYRDLDMLTRFADGSGKNGGDSCGGGVHTTLVASLMAEGLERRQFPMLGAAAVEHAH